MDVTSITNLYRSQQMLQTSSAMQADPVRRAFDSAASRLEQQRQVTSVQVSAYGQVKAGFSKVEDAGKVLAATKSTTAATDVKKALQAFVSAYNDARSTASATEPGSARSAANDLRRTASADSIRSDLRSMGITQKQDGSLSLDSKVLDQALLSNPGGVRTASVRVGGQLQESASRSLAATGSIGASVNSLNAQAQRIEARRAAQQSLMAASQQAVQQQADRMSTSVLGIDSYQKIFSL